jgi:predicted transcriptional regulator
MDNGEKAISINIEEALDLILEGYTNVKIAKHFNIKSVSSVNKYLNNENHSARVREALRQSAHLIAEKAEEVLESIKADATQAEVSRARELAQYYKWLAKVRMPKTYGDKVDVTSGGEKIDRIYPPWMDDGKPKP